MIQKIIAEVLHVDPRECLPGSTFEKDLAADSLDLFQIILSAEEAFHIRLQPEERMSIATVQDLINLIEKKQADKS